MFSNNLSFGMPKLEVEESKRIPAYNIPESISDLSSTVITSITELKKFEEILSYYRRYGYDLFYRGHSDENYKLLPTISRDLSLNITLERKILDKVKIYGKSQGWEKYRLKTFNEDLFYMGIARHLGLYCRLLDWTSSFWVALSFLVHENTDNEGTLWVLAAKRRVAKIADISPFDDRIKNEVYILKEDYFIPDDMSDDFLLGSLRRFRQNGYFTVVPESVSDKPLDSIPDHLRQGIELIKIPISVGLKNELKDCKKIKNVSSCMCVH